MLVYFKGTSIKDCSTLTNFELVCEIILQVHICYSISYVDGAALNDENGEQSKYYGNYSCYVINPGVFAAAAILSLTIVVLGILSYVMVQSAENRGDSRSWPGAAGQPGIAMGQPQSPQQRSQDPVFIQDDTNTRRQIA